MSTTRSAPLRSTISVMLAIVGFLCLLGAFNPWYQGSLLAVPPWQTERTEIRLGGPWQPFYTYAWERKSPLPAHIALPAGMERPTDLPVTTVMHHVSVEGILTSLAAAGLGAFACWLSSYVGKADHRRGSLSRKAA